MADGYLNFDTKINEKGFNDGIKKLGSLGKSGLSVVTKAAAGAVAAIGAMTGTSIKVGATFEAEMSKVSAISGAAGEDLQSLIDKAKEMGAKTKFSATESAQAMEYMAMAGWKTGDMLNGIEGIMNLAAASGENLATTSDIVTDALTAFGLSASDSTHFADILAKASSNANTNVSMMGETFKYVAPVAGALGFSAEDCATAIGLMANSGIKAGQAGTSLRSILARMAKPTDEVQGAMDALGVSITNSDGSMKSLNEIMLKLRNGFSGLTEEQKAQMASALGGQEAMSGLLAIVNASNDDFDKLTDSIANCDGASAKMAATMQDNLKGQLTILKSEAEGLGIEIYESIEVPLKNLAAAGVQTLADLNEAYASGGFEGFISEIGSKVEEQINQLITLAQTKGPEIISNLGTGISSAIPGLVAQGSALMLELVNTITANLPAVITAGVSIIASLVDSLAAQLPQLIPAAVNMILTLVQSLIDNLPQIISSGLKLMQGLAQGIANSIPTVAAKAPVIIAKLVSTIISNLPQILTTGIKIITQLAVGLVRGIPQLIAKIPSMVSQIIHAFTSTNWAEVGINIVKGIASGLTSAAKSLADAAANAASNALNWVKEKLGIHSPSRVFRDQVGKMMALGMGIGFEKNIPVKSMSAGVKRAVGSLKKSAELITSRSTSSNSVDGMRNHPVWGGPTDQTDYDRLERIQMKAAKTIAKRPIYLGTERIDKPLPKGAVPQV